MANDTLTQYVLKDELTQQVIRVFGLQDSSPERQAQLLIQIGQVIEDRIAIEILRVLPDDAKERFVSLIGKNDLNALYAHIAHYVPNPDDFVSKTIRAEVEALYEMYAKAYAEAVPKNAS